MAEVFQYVLRVSLSSTPIILLLLLVLPRFGRRYSAGLRCCIWAMFSVRLLIPFNLSMGWPFLKQTQVENLLNRIDQNAVANAIKTAFLSDYTASYIGQATIDSGVNWNSIAMIWIIGVVLFLGYNAITYRFAMKKLQLWSVPITEPAQLEIFHKAKKQLSINCDIGLYQIDTNHPPMLSGFIRPRIYIPNKQIVSTGFSEIMLHELWHFKRKDLWLKLILLLSTAVHWFNPIVYLLLPHFELDIEMACDNDVLRGASQDARKRYGMTMLSFLEETTSHSTPLTTTFCGGEKQMKFRFSDIIKPNKKKSGIAFTITVVLLVALCSMFVGNSAFASDSQEIKRMDYQAVAAGAAEMPESHGNGEMAWPVPGFYNVASEYGQRYDGTDFHVGMDISEKNISGKSVIAAETGTVVMTVEEYTPGQGYGRYLIIKHNGDVHTLYAHLDEILVKEGAVVEKGQAIATVGSTGFSPEPHLHFEVCEGSVAVTPVTYLSNAK